MSEHAIYTHKNVHKRENSLLICFINRSFLKTTLICGGTANTFVCFHYSSSRVEKYKNIQYFSFKCYIFSVTVLLLLGS